MINIKLFYIFNQLKTGSNDKKNEDLNRNEIEHRKKKDLNKVEIDYNDNKNHIMINIVYVNNKNTIDFETNYGNNKVSIFKKVITCLILLLLFFC